MQHNKTYTLAELQAEVRAEMGRNRHTQEQAATLGKASRSFFNRALNATEYEAGKVKALTTYLHATTGFSVRVEMTYRALRDDTARA